VEISNKLPEKIIDGSQVNILKIRKIAKAKAGFK